jgi:hypothetical protein
LVFAREWVPWVIFKERKSYDLLRVVLVSFGLQ